MELPLPGAGMVCGLRPIVVPEGAPVPEREMELLNPPVTAVVMVALA